MKHLNISAALLALALSLSLAVPALAAPASASTDEVSRTLSALGITQNDSRDAPAMSRAITRAEFVAMAIKATPDGARLDQAATSPYPDVPRSHWASGYVEAAVDRGLVSGYTNGTFRPDRAVNLAEGVSIALGLLGYAPGDFSGAYPAGQLAMYRRLGLDRGVAAYHPGDTLTCQDAMYLFYNLLSANTKAGTPYLNTLGYQLNAAGQVDLLSLVNGEMEGPMVARAGWQSALPFTPSQVIRGGASVSPADIQDYDLIYWNASMGAVRVYTQKATGPIQALEPSGSSPTSVTVAGRSYPIETPAAAYALSDLGQYQLGDTITLLLGRTGGVAAVADVSASAGERVGVVISTANAAYPDGAGGAYTAQSVTLLATDGQTYRYQSANSFREGDIVRATVDPQQGQVTLRGLSHTALSGRVSASGEKLGSYSLAENVQILDVSGQYGAVVYPSRLAGLNLTGDMVRYYSLNSLGQIDTLILNQVTGDMYRYGILTGREAKGDGLFTYYDYRYDLGGATYTLPGSTTGFAAAVGPIQLQGEPSNPERMYSLTATRAGHIVSNQFEADNQKYTLSDQVAVYELQNGQYYLSSLARVQDETLALTAWYDRPEASGGRIRVIVAREQ